MRPRLVAAALPVAAGALASPLAAQCRPPASSHDARLLTFYEAPTAFSLAATPARLRLGEIRVVAEIVPVPAPPASIREPEVCYTGTTPNSRLAPMFGRPRVTVGLPGGVALEGSWFPTLTIAEAEATLASVALSVTRALPLGATRPLFVLRGHATGGRVRGPITCPAARLQTTDANAPCWGSRASRDTFRPNASGVEAALAANGSGRFAAYAGGGVSWLRPRFVTGFTFADGTLDRTAIEVNVARATAFAGATARLRGAFALSLQLYAVPADVTTLRAAVEYRMR